MFIWIILVLLILLVAGGVVIYNRMVKLRVMTDQAWSDVDVQLKRRHDLIPNLVETVKGYAAHEKSTLEEVVKARNVAVTAVSPEDKAQAENMLTRALRQLFALVENYPDLKANTNFLSLQEELAKIEEAIQQARRYYNAVTRDYNTTISVFPNSLVARQFNFTPKPFFQIEEGERSVSRVEF
ncbi:MAG: LemA family protein [Aquificota bacterium]|nr:MAG: LemA family protein [Aquificota bacterium]RLD99389.1 MAG: LemA family protein [Aquificota bacterium]